MKEERIICCFFPQILGHGGIPRFNRNLIRALSEKTEIHSLNDPYLQGGMKGYDRNKLKFVRSFLKSVLRRPSMILLGHINFLPLAFLASIAGLRVTMILHGIEAWHLSRSQKWLSQFVHEFWAVSQFTKETFQGQSKISTERIKRIFNTLPEDWEVGQKGENFDRFFLSVTRLSREERYKGIEETIEALSGIKDHLTMGGWKYVVVAHGDDVMGHKKMVEKAGLQDVIVFKGAISDEELIQLYTTCSFFLLPSTGEGFGIVFLEAMSCKKPCIGAIGCGSSDVIIDGKTGYLVPRASQEIGEAILKLTKDDQLTRRLGSKGFDYLQEKFTFKHFHSRINELIG